MARSEMGTLIARNHEEIEELRRLGERDYIEFTVAAKAPQKVDDVTIKLKSTNPKKEIYTVSLYIDGAWYKKENRTVNEPIFIYKRAARMPTEIVVNDVKKNQIAGYVSEPKSAARP